MGTTKMRVRKGVGVAAVCVLGVAGCSKAPTEAAVDAANAVGKQVMGPLAPKDASRQAEKLLAKIDASSDCEEYRAQVREAGKGSPAAGKTQMAFSQTMQAARDAGCVNEQ